MRTALLLVTALLALAPLGLGQAAPSVDVDLQTLETQVQGQDTATLTASAAAWDAALDEAIAAEDEAEAALNVDDPATQEAFDAASETSYALAKRLAVVVTALGESGADITDYEVKLMAQLGSEYMSAGALKASITNWVNNTKDWAIENGPGVVVKIVVFLLILFVFKILAGMAAKVTTKALSGAKVNMSSLLKTFFVGIVRKVVFVLGLMFALEFAGVNTAPFLAGVGVLGFVVGFALQDTLGNFAAGIMILLYRPYDIGDVVNAGGTTGKVDAMSLVSTTMLTPDNQKVIIPNGSIWGGTITNITANDTRRVDMTIGVGYDDDLDKVAAVLREVVEAHPKVLKDPGVQVVVANLGDSSVDFAVRPWSKTSDYWDVMFDLTKSIKQRLDAEGMSIPYPQRDLHVISMPEGAAQAS